MTDTYAIYSDAGQIVKMFTGKLEDAKMQGAGFIEIEDLSIRDTTHYVDVSGDEPVLVTKQPLDTSYDTNGLEITFNGLPVGLDIEVEGMNVVSDGNVVIEFEVPGDYVIRMSGSLKHCDETLEVSVG